jgi:hypothetical protein
VLEVCGGSEMMAEKFARAGAIVTAIDLSPAAVRRMHELSRRYDFNLRPDGEQTRSFCYIDDCVLGICKLMLAPKWCARDGIGWRRSNGSAKPSRIYRRSGSRYRRSK